MDLSTLSQSSWGGDVTKLWLEFKRGNIPTDIRIGWSISTTMDGGIIFGGENAEAYPNQPTTDLSGMISRHDSQGNELWRDYVYNSGCVAIYSVRQLSQGGYIAAGKAWTQENGTRRILIKYAP